jgi:hypothetical protein
MAKKNKTIVLDESKVIAFFENIDSFEKTFLTDFLKNCAVTNKIIPSEQEFVDYGFTIFKQLGKNTSEYEYSLRAKYFQWKEASWIDGYGQPIKNWKTKLNMTIPSLKPIYQSKNTTDNLLTKLVSNGIPEFQ